MPSLRGTVTERNLKHAFAWESRAIRRCLCFARKADTEGFGEMAAVLRSTAAGSSGRAHRHFEYLEDAGDPASGKPASAPRDSLPASDSLKAAIAGETHEYTDIYPGMARAAREEGFDEIADWFETRAKAGKSHADRFRKALDALRPG